MIKVAVGMLLVATTGFGAVVGPREESDADDAPRIQRALTANGEVFLPKGVYAVSGTLEVPARTFIRGEGAGLSILRTESRGVPLLLFKGSHSGIHGVSLEGPAQGDYRGEEAGISIKGRNAGERLENMRVSNCEIRKFGSYGIKVQFASDATVTHCRIRNIGHAGIMTMSCDGILVDANHVHDISPGVSGNAYGISFTYEGRDPDNANPVSQRCSATNNNVSDIPVWIGLDTHNGQEITFANNRIRNCRLGIHAGGVGAVVPMTQIAITGNTVLGGTAAHLDAGIIVTGRERMPARNILVANNIVEGHGLRNNPNLGAISLYYTRLATVGGNSIRDFTGNGICFYHNNENFLCSGNQVDARGSDEEAMPGIRVSAHDNRGSIQGNRLNGNGIRVDKPSDNRILAGEND